MQQGFDNEESTEQGGRGGCGNVIGTNAHSSP